MAIIYCDLVNGIDWSAQTVWNSGTTYASGALVIPSASGTLSSSGAVVWRSLQDSNTNNTLPVTGDTWWEIAADGSAAKPFKSLGNGTKGTSDDDVRIGISPAHTSIPNPENYTFYSSGTNAGKCIVSGDVTGTWSVGDYIGDDTAFWWVKSVTYSAPNTTIDIGNASYGGCWRNATYTTWIPTTLYKAACITLGETQAITNNGVSRTARKKITCGWDLATETRSELGRTYVSSNFGTSISNKAYIEMDGWCVLGDVYAVNAFYGIFRNIMCVNTGGADFIVGGTYGLNMLIENITIVNAVLSSTNGGNTLNNITILNSWFKCGSSPLSISNLTIVRSASSTVGLITDFYSNSKIILINPVLIGKGSSTYYAFNDANFLKAPKYIWCNNLQTDYTKIVYTAVGETLISQNHQGVTDDHRRYTFYGNILSDTTTRHTAAGVAWRYEPNSNATSGYPLELFDKNLSDPFAVAVEANKQVTATIWCKKSDADSAFEAQFICKGGQLAGITSDVTAVATDSTDWQQLTIQVTPTETGVLRFGFQVWGSATATVNIDDFDVSV